MKQVRGQGQTASSRVSATISKSLGGGGGDTDGEMGGAGNSNSAILNERLNKANTRNRGPERGQGLIGGAMIPVRMMASRKRGM